jgi:hypothetical protein
MDLFRSDVGVDEVYASSSKMRTRIPGGEKFIDLGGDEFLLKWVKREHDFKILHLPCTNHYRRSVKNNVVAAKSFNILEVVLPRPQGASATIFLSVR